MLCDQLRRRAGFETKIRVRHLFQTILDSDSFFVRSPRRVADFYSVETGIGVEDEEEAEIMTGNLISFASINSLS